MSKSKEYLTLDKYLIKSCPFCKSEKTEVIRRRDKKEDLICNHCNKEFTVVYANENDNVVKCVTDKYDIVIIGPMYKFTWKEFGKKEEFVSNNEYDIKEIMYFVTKNSLSVDKIWSECKKLKKGDSTSIHVNLFGYIGCERID